MLRFLSEQNFNSYFYAPKNDAKLRSLWQLPHSQQELTKLEDLLETSTSLDMAFYYCLSPGITLSLGSPRHFEMVKDKFQQLYDLGCRHFALLLDDIPLELMHPQDCQSFTSLAAAQANFVTKLWSLLRTWNGKLVLCPTIYNGLGNDAYLKELIATIPKEVLVFWTGRFICSPALTSDDAREYIRNTGVKPLIWDNYPVNDVDMVDELHIGPLQNRDVSLPAYVSGYVVNPMELAEASKIPLMTVAAYLNEPTEYQPDIAWGEALRQCIGVNAIQPFQDFAETVYKCFLNDNLAPNLMRELYRFRFLWHMGQKDEATDFLLTAIRKRKSAAGLIDRNIVNRKLLQDIQPWLEKYMLLLEIAEKSLLMRLKGASQWQRVRRKAEMLWLFQRMRGNGRQVLFKNLDALQQLLQDDPV